MESNNKNSLGYKVGQALAFVIGVCNWSLYCGYFSRFDCETYSVDFVIPTTERRKT